METADVTKIRQILRSVKFKRKLKKEDGTEEEIEDVTPISIEFDNSLAVSEKTDIVMWDDKNAVVWAVGFNNHNAKSAEYSFGTSKPLNPGVLYAVDYGEIQQFRAELNEKLFDGFMAKFKELGVKVNYKGNEIVISDDCIANAKKFIFNTVDPVHTMKRTVLNFQDKLK